MINKLVFFAVYKIGGGHECIVDVAYSISHLVAGVVYCVFSTISQPARIVRNHFLFLRSTLFLLHYGHLDLVDSCVLLVCCKALKMNVMIRFLVSTVLIDLKKNWWFWCNSYFRVWLFLWQVFPSTSCFWMILHGRLTILMVWMWWITLHYPSFHSVFV